MNIYIPIEVKVRELEGRLLLALAAAERGHSVLLGHKSTVRMLTMGDHLKPGVYHDKSLTPGSKRLTRCETLSRRGFVVTSCDEEGGFLDEDYSNFARLRYSTDTMSHTQSVFCWGQHDYDKLTEVFPALSHRFAITGNPRADFWRRDMKAYFTPSTGDQFVLIASNFGTSLNLRRVWSLAKSLRAKTEHVADDEALNEFRTYRQCAFEVEMLPHFIDAVRRLAASFPETRFVVRPHPTEAEGAWQDMIGDIGNVAVCRAGGISQWIRGARALVHNGCTSALEAAVCGTPVVTFRPLKSPLEREIPNRIGCQANDVAELIKRVGDVLSGAKASDWDNEATRSLLEERFSALDGPLAADRIVDRWDTFTEPQLCRANSWTEISRLLERREAKRPARRGTASIAPEDDKSNSSHKFPGMTPEELDGIIHSLQRALNRFHNVRVNVLNDRSVALTS